MTSILDAAVAQLTKDQELEEVRARLQTIRMHVAAVDRAQCAFANVVDDNLSRAYQFDAVKASFQPVRLALAELARAVPANAFYKVRERSPVVLSLVPVDQQHRRTNLPGLLLRGAAAHRYRLGRKGVRACVRAYSGCRRGAHEAHGGNVPSRSDLRGA